jgi:hypothetical protein
MWTAPSSNRSCLATPHCDVALTSRPSRAGSRVRAGPTLVVHASGPGRCHWCPYRGESDLGISSRCQPGWCVRAARGLSDGAAVPDVWHAVGHSTPGNAIGRLAHNDAPAGLVAASSSPRRLTRRAREAGWLAGRLVSFELGSTPRSRQGGSWCLSRYRSQRSTTSQCGTTACGRNDPT